MLDWLRRRMGCVSSHEEVEPIYNNMTENNINKFKVTTDESLASDGGLCIKSGILQINDDELLLYQKHGETIRWSFKSLRRFGQGSDTFLFESGRRCTTGIGLFAFKCRRADILHNVFAEKLRRFSSTVNGGGDNTMLRQLTLNSAPNRYSEGVIRSPAPIINTADVEPYLTPISTMAPAANSYVNGDTMYGQMSGTPYVNLNGQQPNDYINTGENGGNATTDTHNYTNTGPQAVNGINKNINAVSASSNGTSVTSSAATNGGTPVRELNYAELDLPRSDAIGFPQTHRQNGTAAASVKANSIQYVDIPAYNDDDDDDAFLPASNMTTPAHVKGIIRQASVDSAGQRSLSHSNSHMSYVNIEGAHSQSNGKIEMRTQVNGMSQVQYTGPGGMSQVQYTGSGVRSSLAADKSTGGDNNSSNQYACTQYTTIDFQKTSALASASKSNQLQSEASQEGLRKTRHDSSADDLN